ncbi:MAG: hypothetical protein RLZZ387_827 [Chloroflexota bacterium]|jgi:phosphoglycolate phosphatase
MLEIIRPRPGTRPRVALLDFDGTLSLVRGGWQQIMQGLMLDALRPLATHEPQDALAARVADAIDRLTGHPTLAQMEWLRAEVLRRGGCPDSADSYKRRYLELLDARVASRLGALRTGRAVPDDLLVPGSRALLEGLRDAGTLLVLASGTDLVDVRREAEALQITDFFGPHIYGPGPHDPAFTKRTVIDRLLAELGLGGHELLAIGDGPVEIRETRAVSGVTVGVALDELRGAGLDHAKRERLIAAGADVIVADLTPVDALLGHLLG